MRGIPAWLTPDMLGYSTGKLLNLTKQHFEKALEIELALGAKTRAQLEDIARGIALVGDLSAAALDRYEEWLQNWRAEPQEE